MAGCVAYSTTTLLPVKRPRTSPSGSSLPCAVGRTLACPKSASLIWQSLLTSTLLGLRSRWMMRLSCKNSTAGCGIGGCTRATKKGDNNWTYWLQRNPHHLHRPHPRLHDPAADSRLFVVLHRQSNNYQYSFNISTVRRDILQ